MSGPDFRQQRNPDKILSFPRRPEGIANAHALSKGEDLTLTADLKTIAQLTNLRRSELAAKS